MFELFEPGSTQPGFADSSLQMWSSGATFLSVRKVAAGILYAVEGRDVRMVERREHLRLAREARDALGVAGEALREDLQRDVAPELGVSRAIHLAHAASPERAGDRIRPEPGSGRQCQWMSGL